MTDADSDPDHSPEAYDPSDPELGPYDPDMAVKVPVSPAVRYGGYVWAVWAVITGLWLLWTLL